MINKWMMIYYLEYRAGTIVRFMDKMDLRGNGTKLPCVIQKYIS